MGGENIRIFFNRLFDGHYNNDKIGTKDRNPFSNIVGLELILVSTWQ